MKLKGKIAILTAAAGAGIGRTMARTFAREGASVVLTDIHEERTKQIAYELKKEYGVQVIGIKCDVLNLQDIKNVVKITMETFGRIDILFNNAGTNRPSKIIDITDENWEIVMGVSLRSVFYFTREVLPIMMEQQ